MESGASDRPNPSGMGLVARVAWLIDRLAGAGHLLAEIVLLALMTAVTMAVISRAIVGQPMAWVIELTGAALLYMTFLSIAYVAKTDEHVRIDLVGEFLGGARLRWLDAIALAVQVLVTVALLVATAQMTIDNYLSGRTTAGALNMDRWLVDLVIPVGCAVLLMQLLKKAPRVVRGTEGPEDKSQPPSGI